MVGKDLANEEVTTSIEEIIRINAAAVGISVYIGSEYEHQTLMALSKLVNDCSAYGIPVMAVTAVGREEEKEDLALPGAGLPHLRRIGRQGGQDLLLPRFRKGDRRLPGAGGDCRRAAHRERPGSAANSSMTACSRAPSASTWVATSGRTNAPKAWRVRCRP